jgi:hypothetical protein
MLAYSIQLVDWKQFLGVERITLHFFGSVSEVKRGLLGGCGMCEFGRVCSRRQELRHRSENQRRRVRQLAFHAALLWTPRSLPHQKLLSDAIELKPLTPSISSRWKE